MSLPNRQDQWKQGDPESLICRHCKGPRTRLKKILFCKKCDAPEVEGRRLRPTWQRG